MKINSIVVVLSTAFALAGCGSNSEALIITADEFCGINAPLPGTPINRQEELLAWGWAFDKSNGTIPNNLSMELISTDKKFGLRIPLTRDARPDVAKAFNLPIEMAGYKTKVNLKTLAPGQYTISIVQSEKERIIICNGQAPFSVH